MSGRVGGCATIGTHPALIGSASVCWTAALLPHFRILHALFRIEGQQAWLRIQGMASVHVSTHCIPGPRPPVTTGQNQTWSFRRTQGTSPATVTRWQAGIPRAEHLEAHGGFFHKADTLPSEASGKCVCPGHWDGDRGLSRRTKADIQETVASSCDLSDLACPTTPHPPPGIGWGPILWAISPSALQEDRGQSRESSYRRVGEPLEGELQRERQRSSGPSIGRDSANSPASTASTSNLTPEEQPWLQDC